MTSSPPGSAWRPTLRSLLDDDEVDAVRDRIERLLADGRFPEPEPGVRPYPWPPI